MLPGAMKAIPGKSSGLTGLIGRIIATIIAVAAMVVGLMFSVVLFIVALVAGLAVFGWMGWKIRRALKQARADPLAARHGPAGQEGQVIEGEVIHSEWKDNHPPR